MTRSCRGVSEISCHTCHNYDKRINEIAKGFKVTVLGEANKGGDSIFMEIIDLARNHDVNSHYEALLF